MSRPRRYGPARSVRLPLEADDALVARASASEQPVSVWMRDQLLNLLDVKPQRKVEPAAPPAPKRDVAKAAAGEEAEQRADELAAARACPHERSTFNGTVHICDDCHKVVKR